MLKFRELGVLQNIKGAFLEYRVVEAFKRCDGLPDWLSRVEHAPKKLDSGGVDVIVFTVDVGKVYIQVKSSKTGERAFRKLQKQGRYSPHIEIVVIDTEDSDLEVRKKVITAAGILRDRFLKKKLKNK